MTTRAFHTVLQLLAALAMMAGVFLLFGVPWAMLVGGFAIFTGSVASEASARPVVRAVVPAGDR